MRSALLLALLAPLPAFAAHAPMQVRAVQIDLDGDGVKDTVTELSTGTKNNLLRVELSKTKRKLEFGNLLVNPRFGDQGMGCNGHQPNELVARKENWGGGVRASVLVKRQHGINDGCDTGYSTHESSFALAVNDDGALVVDELNTRDYVYAHHDGTETVDTKVSLFLSWVKLDDECGYHEADGRSRTFHLPEGCAQTLADYDATGKPAACVQATLDDMWKNLWPKGEQDDNPYCKGKGGE